VLYQLSYISSKTFNHFGRGHRVTPSFCVAATLRCRNAYQGSALPTELHQLENFLTASARNFFFVLLVANLISPKVQDSPYRKQDQYNQRQGPNADLAISNR
jgi:hypothetical protein